MEKSRASSTRLLTTSGTWPATIRPSASGPAAKYSLDGHFDSVFVGSNLASLQLFISTYTGGAHPNSTTYGFNFNRLTSKELTLDDALGLIDLTIEEVSAQTAEQLKAKLDTVFFPDGAPPDPKNYQNFIVGPDKVTFIFQAYQVGPYAAGPQEVSFPMKSTR